jgi:hypothetical protein
MKTNYNIDKDPIVSKNEYVLYPEYSSNQKSVALLSPKHPHAHLLQEIDQKSKARIES